MSSDIVTLEEHENNDDSIITIPIKKRDLGDFISSLLGQQQALERTYSVNFEINHAWLINLHEIIHQRIFQQANAELVKFTAVVYFDDGIKRTITTIESFLAYNETKPEISKGVSIVWEYLIQFPNRPHPEKQQISFSAHTIEKKPKSTIGRLASDSISEAFINVQIDHTERTWGDDIETIISNCVSEVSFKPSFSDHVFWVSRIFFAFLIFLAMGLYPMYLAETKGADIAASFNLDYQALRDATTISQELINQKLDMIFDEISAIESKRDGGTFLLFFFLFTLSPVISFGFLGFTSPTRKSFVLLTQEAIKQRDKIARSNKKKIGILIVSYIFGIAGSVLASYGYDWLKTL